MMDQKKIIVVFGATGAQGGGVARAILNDPRSEFAVRAVTRKPDSDKARELAKLGAEVVSGEIDDPQSLKRVLSGAYGAFFVTFFWDHFSAEKETAEAKNMAQAAKEAGLQHVIWSTLEDTRDYVPLDDQRMPTLQGKYKVPHFDGKGEADKFFVEAGVPVTFLNTTFYWENMLYFGMGPQKQPDGKYALTFPMGNKKLSGISAEDIGKCAYGIFKRGKELIGKRVGIAGDQLSVEEMARVLTKTLGKEVSYHEITPEQYRNLGFPGADDLANMFQFYRDFEEDFTRNHDLNFARELNPELKSFEKWASENAARMAVE